MAKSSVSSLAEAVVSDPDSFNDFRTKSWELPEDLTALKNCLVEKALPVDSWMRICMIYYGQAKYEKFEQLTWDMYAAMPETAEFDKLRVLSVLASFYIHKSYTDEFREDTVEKLFECIKKADRMEARNPELMIAKSNYYLLKQKDLSNYVKYGQRAYLEQNQNSFNPQYIGIHKVASDFQRFHYEEAKAQLEVLIEKNKSSSLSPFLHLTLASIILETLKENKVEQLSLPFKLVTKVHNLLEENKQKNPAYEQAYTSLFVLASQVSALIELKRGNTNKYVQHISDAFKKDQHNCVTLVHMAHVLHSLNRFEEAKKTAEDGLRSLKHFISLPPQNQLKQFEEKMRFDVYEIESRFHYYIGFYFHRQGDISNALIEYRAAVDEWEHNDMALYSLAQVRCSLGEKGEALSAVRRLLEHRKDLPESADCFAFFARVFHENGYFEEAKKYYKKAIFEDPSSFFLRFRYAYLLEETESGVYGSALEKYEEGMKLVEAQGHSLEIVAPEILNNITLQYMKWKKSEYLDMMKATKYIQTAEAALEKSILGSKGQADKEAKLLVVKQTYASLLEARGKFIQAEEKHREILKLSPLAVDSYIRISELHIMKGKMIEAKEVVAEGIRNFASILKNMEVVLNAKHEVRRSIEKSVEFLYQQEGNLLSYEGMVDGARKKFDKENPSPGLVLSKGRLDYLQKVKLGDSKKVAHSLGDRIKEFSRLNRTKTHRDHCYAGQMILIEAALQPFDVSPDFASILYMPLLNDPVFTFNMGVYNFTKELYEDSAKRFRDALQNHTFAEIGDYENIIYCLVGSLLNKKKEEDEEEENKKVLSLLRKLIFLEPERQVNTINFLRNLYWTIIRNEEDKSVKNWEDAIKTTNKIYRMMEVLRKCSPKGEVLHRDADKLTDSFYETVRPATVYMNGRLQKQRQKEEERKRAMEQETLQENQREKSQGKFKGQENENPAEVAEISKKEKIERVMNQIKMKEYELERLREEKAKEEVANGNGATSEKKKMGSKKKGGGGAKKKGKKEVEKGSKSKKKRDDDEEMLIPLEPSSDEHEFNPGYDSEDDYEKESMVVSSKKQEIKTDSEDNSEKEGHPAPVPTQQLEAEAGGSLVKKKKLRRIEAEEDE